MPHIQTDDNVSLYVEDVGQGTAVVFAHEFAGDYRSWAPQVRYLSRRYRCITYSARGYAPSEVPADASKYSQQRARDDLRCVLDALGIERAHVVGLSMGAFAALHFGMAFGTAAAPVRALSLTLAGVGTGSHPAAYANFQREATALADTIEREGWRKPTATARRGCSFAPKTHRALPSLCNDWPSTRRWVRPTPCAVTRPSGPACTT